MDNREVGRIKQEAERRKERATSLGLPANCNYLQRKLEFDFEKIKKMTSVKVGVVKKNRYDVTISIKGKEYTFIANTSGTEIVFNNEKVFKISWNDSVIAFIEGDWVKDFTEFVEEIRKNEEECKRREEAEETERLKKDFGIE